MFITFIKVTPHLFNNSNMSLQHCIEKITINTQNGRDMMFPNSTKSLHGNSCKRLTNSTDYMKEPYLTLEKKSFLNRLLLLLVCLLIVNIVTTWIKLIFCTFVKTEYSSSHIAP